MKKIWKSLPFRLILGVIIGIILGQAANETFMNVIVSLRYILSQVINFCVPLIIIGFIAPSITKLGSSASRMLGVALVCAYASSVLIGLAAAWTKAKNTIRLLEEFQKMILLIVTKVVIPILPFFIAATFCTLSYEGTITKQLPVFIQVIIIVLIGHYIWLALLYGVAGIYCRTNPLKVLKNYGPAYITAIGTMSSAATMAVALKCAKKSEPALRDDMVDFGIPLFANIHLCGSVLTEVFFVMTVSKILYGSLPDLGTMVLFCFLLGVFAIGAPGVPGGTVMASLGLITGVVGFDETGTALILTIFALQDSFGTACNITGDGALTMILTGYARKHDIKEQKIELEL